MCKKKIFNVAAKVMLISFLNLIFMMPANIYASEKSSSNNDIQIIAPENGSTFNAGEKVQVQVLVNKKYKVSLVQLMCDSKGIGLSEKSPYAFDWDTSNISDGKYVLRATVFLSNNQKISSSPVVVEIKQSANSVSQTQNVSVLKEGTPIVLITEEEMISGKIKQGSTIHFKVDKDITGPNGEILISSGAMAYGEVTKSEGHGMLGKSGKLDFKVTSVTAADGTAVNVRAKKDGTAENSTGWVVAGAILLSVLCVFFNGANVEIPSGTSFTAFVSSDTTVKPLPSKSALINAQANSLYR